MRIRSSVVVTFVAVTLGAGLAHAQQTPSVGITPYVALGSSAASPVGAAATIPITSNLAVETDVAYRRGEGNMNALSTSASLLYFLPKVGAISPYVAGGLGLSQYGVAVSSAATGGPIGTESRLGLTVNAGGGLKLPMNDTLDLRTDARWFKTRGQGSDQFRVSQGISFDVGKR